MHTHALPNLQRTLIGAMAFLAVAGIFQNVVGNGERDNGDVGYLVVMLAVNALIGAWLFLRVMPRAVEAGPDVAARRAAVMGAVGAVSVVAFWLGLPITLGIAAAVLGVEARRRGAGGVATLAIVLGALAVLGASGITIMDLTSAS